MMNQMPFKLERIGRRLVIGQDLLDIKEAFELTLMDVTYLLGSYGPRYHKMVDEKNLARPVSSVTRALLARFITDWAAEERGFPAASALHPWPLLIPKPPSGEDFDQMVLEHASVLHRDWPGIRLATQSGILLGLSGTRTTERWRDSSPQPVVQRLMTYLLADIEDRGEIALIEHMRRIELEVRARGHQSVDELFSYTRWNSVKKISAGRTSLKPRRQKPPNNMTAATA